MVDAAEGGARGRRVVELVARRLTMPRTTARPRTRPRTRTIEGRGAARAAWTTTVTTARRAIAPGASSDETRAETTANANANGRGKETGGGKYDARYYAGMLTEPVRADAFDATTRDVMTPTMKLVTRSAIGLVVLFGGFLWSNGLPPFDGTSS